MAKLKAFVLLVKSKIVGLFSKFRSLNLKKKIAVIIILIIVFGVVFSTVRNATKSPGYTIAKVGVGSVEEIVSESGTISVSNRTDIYSPTNGIVTKVHVKNGDLVTKNQLLFEVESTATEQEKRAAEANYLAAVTALNSAQANADSLQANMFSQWQSFKETAESSAFENSDGTPRSEERSKADFHVAEKTWTAAEKNYKNAETAIAQAQANVTSAKLLLDATKDSKVKATAGGKVENLSVDEGGSVVINQVLAPVRAVLTLVGSAPVEVIIDLGESEVVKVDSGMKAELDVSAVDKKYRGKVVRVDTVGTENAGVVRYGAYIQIENPDEKLRPGMSVDADIKTKTAKNVLIVPNSAVKPYQGGRAVRVPGEKKGEVEYIAVEVGIRGMKNTEILKGLVEGQEIITALSNESIKRPGLF